MVRGGDKVRMPSSGAGITQYWDDVETKIEIKPQYVIALAILIIVIMLLLQQYGAQIFGLQ